MGLEGLELLGRAVSFQLAPQPDRLLEQFGDPQMMGEMQKVFFSEGANSLGHSYARLTIGPGGRNDLQDVIQLLQKEPATKRALVNFASQPNGKIPCVTAVQFLIRQDSLNLMYFARGQDAFRKFYADALCLVTMARKVATALALPMGVARGFIGSAHIYDRDLPEIRQTLKAVRRWLESQPAAEVTA